MSLIAYLMEKKSNFGPHLIIVPNAVLVNWKAELTLWLPTVRCVYYTGNKVRRTICCVTGVGCHRAGRLCVVCRCGDSALLGAPQDAPRWHTSSPHQTPLPPAL